jgi:hypothetical protein
MSLQRDRSGWVLTFSTLACLVACGRSSQRAPDGGSPTEDGGAGRGEASDSGAAGSFDAAEATDSGAAGSPDLAEASDVGAAGAPDAAQASDVGAAGSPDPGDAGDGALGMTGAAGVTAGTTGGTAGGGDAGSVGGAGGAAADAGAACGDVGQPCCASDACNGNLACLGGTTCSCVGALYAHYLVRTDGKALLEINDAPKTQRPVLDATTGVTLADVASIHEGYAHACALLGTAKTVWCWRTDVDGNSSGQLGSGATDTNGAVFLATQVLAGAGRPLTNVTAIAQSYTPIYSNLHQVNASCAVTGDGHLYCWGDLTYLTGNGSAKSSPYAVQVMSNGSTPVAGALAVSLSSDFECALLQGTPNKEVWCWGNNGSYEVLGQTDQNSRQYPAKVLGLTNPSKVVSADSTVCALDGGQVRCWGNNAHGEAGVGNFNSPVPSPTSVVLASATPIANISDLSAGNNLNGRTTSYCGLDDTASKLLCWGNAYHEYASADSVPDVVAVGAVDEDSTNGQSLVRALTSDGLYHVGAVTRQPNCGVLP